MQELDLQLDLSQVPQGFAHEVRCMLQMFHSREKPYLVYQISLAKPGFGKNEVLHTQFPKYYAENSQLCIIHVFLAAEEHVAIGFGSTECVFGKTTDLELLPNIKVQLIVSMRTMPLGQEIYTAVKCALPDSPVFQLENALGQPLFREPRILLGQNGELACGTLPDEAVFFTLNKRLPLEIEIEAAIGNTFIILVTKIVDYMAIARTSGVEQIELTQEDISCIPKEAYEMADTFEKANGNAVIYSHLKGNMYGVTFESDKKQLKKLSVDVFKENSGELQKLIKKFNYKRLCKSVDDLLRSLVFQVWVTLPFSMALERKIEYAQSIYVEPGLEHVQKAQPLLSPLLNYVSQDVLEHGDVLLQILSPGIYEIGGGGLSVGAALSSINCDPITNVFVRGNPILLKLTASGLVLTNESTKDIFVLETNALEDMLDAHPLEDCLFNLSSASGQHLLVLFARVQINAASSELPTTEQQEFQKKNEVVDPDVKITDETIIIDARELELRNSTIQKLEQEEKDLKEELSRLQLFEANLLVNQELEGEVGQLSIKDLDICPNIGSINLVRYYCGLDVIPAAAHTRLELMQFIVNTCTFKRLSYAAVNMISEVTRICEEAARIKTLCGKVQGDLCLEQECLINQMENKLIYLQKIEMRNSLVMERQNHALMGPQDLALREAIHDIPALKQRSKSKPPSVLAPLRGDPATGEEADVMDQIRQMME